MLCGPRDLVPDRVLRGRASATATETYRAARSVHAHGSVGSTSSRSTGFDFGSTGHKPCSSDGSSGLLDARPPPDRRDGLGRPPLPDGGAHRRPSHGPTALGKVRPVAGPGSGDSLLVSSIDVLREKTGGQHTLRMLAAATRAFWASVAHLTARDRRGKGRQALAKLLRSALRTSGRIRAVCGPPTARTLLGIAQQPR
jgi:hypothetical protein